MNRRAILAGLLVVVLVALAVVLVTGGGDQQAQAVKGTPFLGESGITRSVAAIKADQRYLDAHPEIEVRRNRQLAAEEAAREAANEEASHEGEASGEEESAGEDGEAAQAEGARAEHRPRGIRRRPWNGHASWASALRRKLTSVRSRSRPARSECHRSRRPRDCAFSGPEARRSGRSRQSTHRPVSSAPRAMNRGSSLRIRWARSARARCWSS